MDVCRVAMELHGLENFAVNERPLRMKAPKSYAELAKVRGFRLERDGWMDTVGGDLFVFG